MLPLRTLVPVVCFAGLALVLPACGLTLDYDPPTDAGARIDGPGLDAGERRDGGPRDGGETDAGPPCGGCSSDRVCFEGVCRLRCTGTSCSDEPGTCEACVEGICLPADPSCPGGSACAVAACDPMTDECTTTSTCGAGLSCSMGACVPGACAGDLDCTALLDTCDEPFECGPGGVCVPRPRDVCPALARSCAVIDACTCLPTDARDPALCGGLRCDPETANCVACLEAGDCAAGQHCHPSRRECVECVENGDCAVGVCDPSSFTCVECTDITHCPDFGTTLCDPTTRECVECLGNADCTVSSEPHCAGGACVECLSSADCESSRPVCGADGSCGPCSFDTDCGPGEACSMGTCVLRGCETDGDCPSVGCVHGTCSPSTRSCIYTEDDSFCGPGGPGDDFIGCTHDACDTSAGTFDLCVHRADDNLCPDDGFSCTQERCNAAFGSGGPLGCTTVRDDAACAPSTSLGCAIGVCAGGEPGAIVSPTTGCGLTYEPRRCGLLGVCAVSGQCQLAPTCLLTRDCPDDGNACNGALECRLGTCQPVDIGATECAGSPACATYCSTSGCALRTDPPRDAVCAVMTFP